jgi:hypothetical protein
MSARESVPTTWTTADETFFRVVAQLLPPSFLAAAGTLLASHDDELEGSSGGVPDPAPVAPRPTAADEVRARVRPAP